MKSALKYGCLALLALGLIALAGLLFLAWNAKPLPSTPEALASLPAEERMALESLCRAAGIATTDLRHLGGHLDYLYDDKRNHRSFDVSGGHVRGICLRGAKFATVPDFRAFATIEVIDLAQGRFPGWPDFSSLAAVERLVLSGTELAEPAAAVLPPNVVTLRMAATPVASTAPFAGLKKLTALDLSATPVTDFTPLTVLALDELNLENSKVTRLPPAVPGKGDWEVNLDGTVVVMPPGYSRTLPPQLYNGKELAGQGELSETHAESAGAIADAIEGPSRLEWKGGTDPSVPPVKLDITVTGGKAQIWMVEPPGLFVSPWFEQRQIKGFGLLRQPGWVFATVDPAQPARLHGKLRLDTRDRTYDAPGSVRSQPGWSPPADACDYSLYILPLDGKPVTGLRYRVSAAR